MGAIGEDLLYVDDDDNS